jgi:hypothetical protein
LAELGLDTEGIAQTCRQMAAGAGSHRPDRRRVS